MLIVLVPEIAAAPLLTTRLSGAAAAEIELERRAVEGQGGAGEARLLVQIESADTAVGHVENGPGVEVQGRAG